MKSVNSPRVVKKKLPKRLQELLDVLECHIGVCAGYDDVSGNPKCSLRTVSSGVLRLLAGTGTLDPIFHAQLAKAGYIASKEQVEACQKAAKNYRKGKEGKEGSRGTKTD
jgi:hypothetical protein